MKPILRLFFATSVFVSVLVSTVELHAANQRMESWGRGASEFEAVKSAYKVLLADSLKLLAGTSATNSGVLRRVLEREIEEDLLKTKRVFFPDASENCERNSEVVECLIVAAVRMDELEAWVRVNIAGVGSGANRVSDIRFALMAKSTDETSRDFLRWLHSELEQDFGHDIYFSDSYIEPKVIRQGCDEYARLAKQFEAQGASYKKTARSYRNNLSVCQDLINTDVVIVVDDLRLKIDAFNHADKSMTGRVRVALDFVQTKSKRALAPPKPRSVSHYGYGADQSIAEAELRDNLYEATANYISQQFNDIVIVALKSDKVSGGASDLLRYEVTVAGVDSDSAEGRKKLAFVRQWFVSEHGLELGVDYDQSEIGKTLHRFSSEHALNLTTIVDGLYLAMDKKAYPVRIDVDRNHNLTVTFKGDGKQADKQVSVAVNAKSIQRKIKVEASDMVLRRRDPETGITIALNEANIKLRNSSRRDLLVAVNPVWASDNGVSEPSPYSEEKFLILPAKSSQSFVFRAPNKYATSVSLAINCPTKSCKVAKE